MTFFDLYEINENNSELMLKKAEKKILNHKDTVLKIL